jgi:hypothetical protein
MKLEISAVALSAALIAGHMGIAAAQGGGGGGGGGGAGGAGVGGAGSDPANLSPSDLWLNLQQSFCLGLELKRIAPLKDIGPWTSFCDANPFVSCRNLGRLQDNCAGALHRYDPA